MDIFGVGGGGAGTLVIQPTTASPRLGEYICSPYNLQRFGAQERKRAFQSIEKKENLFPNLAEDLNRHFIEERKQWLRTFRGC